MPRDFAKNFGCIVSNEANEILHYAEKPETFVSDTISCGIYVFSPEIFEKLSEVYDANNSGCAFQSVLCGREKFRSLIFLFFSFLLFFSDRTEHSDILSLETDLLVKEAGSGKFYLFKTEGSWGQMKSAGLDITLSVLSSLFSLLHRFRSQFR